MLLQDVCRLTLGHIQAAARRWSGRRPGGVVFWDHDLFGSYAVLEGDRRVYPTRPNEFTPLPGSRRSHRWVVVSEQLAREACAYGGGAAVQVLPNALPTIPPSGLEPRHHAFRAGLGISAGRPILP